MSKRQTSSAVNEKNSIKMRTFPFQGRLSSRMTGWQTWKQRTLVAIGYMFPGLNIYKFHLPDFWNFAFFKSIYMQYKRKHICPTCSFTCHGLWNSFMSSPGFHHTPYSISQEIYGRGPQKENGRTSYPLSNNMAWKRKHNFDKIFITDCTGSCHLTTFDAVTKTLST